MVIKVIGNIDLLHWLSAFFLLYFAYELRASVLHLWIGMDSFLPFWGICGRFFVN